MFCAVHSNCVFR